MFFVHCPKICRGFLLSITDRILATDSHRLQFANSAKLIGRKSSCRTNAGVLASCIFIQASRREKRSACLSGSIIIDTPYNIVITFLARFSLQPQSCEHIFSELHMCAKRYGRRESNARLFTLFVCSNCTISFIARYFCVH